MIRVFVIVGPLLSTPTRLFDVVDFCTPSLGPAFFHEMALFLWVWGRFQVRDVCCGRTHGGVSDKETAFVMKEMRFFLGVKLTLAYAQ